MRAICLIVAQAAKVFTAFDLLSRFWQVPLFKQAQECTAFSVGYKYYEFTRIPFGLMGAPTNFALLMRKVLDGLGNVAVYGDDVIIFSSTESEHIGHTDATPQRLRRASLVLNKSAGEGAGLGCVVFS